ncbi:MAG: glycosyltransferase involved in cell wall biosynthesis [Vicingaceae bacterium]|jgi:glycosyltransferase involved in cell wall biosynthesis
MKLLHCLSSPHIGGVERLVIELAIAQNQAGIDVSIMLDTRKGQYYEYLQQQNIPIIDSGVKSGFDFNFKTYQDLKQQFEVFDVIHLHDFSPLRSLAAIQSTTQTVYTIHGLSKGVRKGNKIQSLIRESIKKYCLNKVDVLVANSNYTLSLAKEHYQLKKTESVCILNGIKLPEPTEKPIQLNDEFTIGLVSRFTKRKRIDLLIETFKKYKESGGEGKLILVGDGSEFNAIQSEIKKLNLVGFVELVGYTANVEEYYRQFDLCVFPFQDEPFGLVAVEAYLNGKAVLAFNDSGGLKEVIEPIEPDNIVSSVDEMVTRLLYWSKNKNLLQSGSENRKVYAIESFSVERMANDYLKVYNQTLKAK